MAHSLIRSKYKVTGHGCSLWQGMSGDATC